MGEAGNGRRASGGEFCEKNFKHARLAEKQNITVKKFLKLYLILKRKLEWGRLGKPQSGPSN